MISKKLLMIGTNILCKIYNCTKKEKEKLTTNVVGFFNDPSTFGRAPSREQNCNSKFPPLIWGWAGWVRRPEEVDNNLTYQSSWDNLPFINFHNQFFNYITIDSVRFHLIYHWNNRIFDKSILTESTLISISIMNYFQ